MRLVRALARLVPWALVAVQGWLLDRLVIQHGRALLEQERLRRRLARVEWMVADLARRQPDSTGGAGEPSRAEAEAPRASPTSQSAAEDR